MNSNRFISSTKFQITIQALQLVGITAIMFGLNVERDLGLPYFFAIFSIFFPIHALAMPSKRLHVQLAFFLVVLFVFLPLMQALWVIFWLVVFMSLAIAPLPLKIKYVTLAMAMLYLFACRFGWLPSPYSAQVITILAGIFMFRLILFLYYYDHTPSKESLMTKLGYFLFPPNIIFPLFPIIDYQVYLKNKYNVIDQEIYQRGINLILWSLCCLLIYRVVYYSVIPDISNAKGVLDIGLYLVSTFLTVIRLIGILSLCVGILRMLGYNLPEIFNQMFLATSFSDLFRRINIYWKDFMMKIIYYPVYFKLRKLKIKGLITWSLIATFVGTWFFHIYQWSWILGSNPIRITGLVYWGVFGALAMWGSMKELKAPPVKSAHSISNSIRYISKILGVFIGMSVLYSIWVNASFQNWWKLIRIAFYDEAANWVVFFIILGGVWFLAVATHFLFSRTLKKWAAHYSSLSYSYSWIAILLGLCATFTLSQISNEKVVRYVENISLNENDIRQQHEGYYESILRADVSSRLWDDDIDLALLKRKDRILMGLKNVSTPATDEDITVNTDEMSKFYAKDRFLTKRFMPDLNTKFKGKSLITNEYGFRDKPYYKKRGDNKAFRVALIGGSPDMGYGVGENDYYEAIAENRINQKYPNTPLEIINFSLPDLGLLSKLYVLENIALDFDLDHVILVDHFDMTDQANDRLDRLLKKGSENFPTLERELKRIQVKEEDILLNRVSKEKMEYLFTWAYHQFANLCKRKKLPCTLLHFPVLGRQSSYDQSVKMISQAGFHFIDHKDVYTGYTAKDVNLSRKDDHPNEFGHSLLAERFEKSLIEILKIK